MPSIPVYKFTIFRGIGFNSKTKEKHLMVGYILKDLKSGKELAAGLQADTNQSDFEITCWAYGDIVNKTGIVMELPKRMKGSGVSCET